MKIGLLKEHLRKAPLDHAVYFDFCNCVPTTVESWRGIYAEPALGWDAAGYSGSGQECKVADLLAELEKATSGNVYTGWKGGEYTYDDSSPLHVDNRGDSTRTQIVFVEVKSWCVILHTISEEE